MPNKILEFSVQERKVVEMAWMRYVQAVEFIRQLHDLENVNCTIAPDRSGLLEMPNGAPQQ